MGTYPDTAVERAMKIQEVLLRAMSSEHNWVQAAAMVGLSDRQRRQQRHPWLRECASPMLTRESVRAACVSGL